MGAREDRRAEHQPEDPGRIHRGELFDERDAGRTEERTADAARDREHQRFGEDLADDLTAARADRDTDGDLALPRRAARQHQICHVRTHDQQHDRDRGEQHSQGRPQRRHRLFLDALHLESRTRRQHRAGRPWRTNRRAERQRLFGRGLKRDAISERRHEVHTRRRLRAIEHERREEVLRPLGNSNDAGMTPITVSVRAGMGAISAPVRSSIVFPRMSGSEWK